MQNICYCPLEEGRWLKLGRIWWRLESETDIRQNVFKRYHCALVQTAFFVAIQLREKLSLEKKARPIFFNVRDALLIFVRHAHGHSTLCLWHYVRTD